MRSLLWKKVEDSTTRELNSRTTLGLDSYTVYTLSAADKLGHTEHTLQYLAHVWASVSLFHSVQSPTGPLTSHFSFLLVCNPTANFEHLGLRNKVIDRPKLDVGYVAWTSINLVSLSARPHPITTHDKPINIYLLVTFRTDRYHQHTHCIRGNLLNGLRASPIDNLCYVP